LRWVCSLRCEISKCLNYIDSKLSAVPHMSASDDIASP
jgi:hypothetical protein